MAVLALAISSAAVAVVIDRTSAFNILILVGAVLEALSYAVAGLCVIQLRHRQPHAIRSFRIPLGWTVPILAILIFSVLGLAASVTPTPVPLVIVAGLFILSYLYVRVVVPRLKAAEAARRQARGRRRPPRAAVPFTPTST